MLRLMALLLALMLVCAALLYVLPVSLLGRHDSYGAEYSLPAGYTHVLLIGIDTNAQASSRSDTMMIASIGQGRVLLTSLQRDTGVYIPGYSGLHRLNAAYNYGGAELLLATVNRNFKLSLSLYALVDYESFASLIDLIGGVDIDGVTAAEIEQLNHNVRDVLWRRYYAGEMTQEEIINLYRKIELSGSGSFHFNGLQALGYARIRKTDSDYGRTSRQRKLVKAALGALKSSGPVTIARFAVKGAGSVETNMNMLELISLGEKALFCSEMEQTRLPVNGTYTDDGGMFYNVDYDKNHDAFISFVYGK